MGRARLYGSSVGGLARVLSVSRQSSASVRDLLASLGFWLAARDGALGDTAGQCVACDYLRFVRYCVYRDGAVGAEFLKAFKGYIENPLTMLV